MGGIIVVNFFYGVLDFSSEGSSTPKGAVQDSSLGGVHYLTLSKW